MPLAARLFRVRILNCVNSHENYVRSSPEGQILGDFEMKIEFVFKLSFK